jgi:hypothetical protein
MNERGLPADLRDRLIADFAPVRPLPSPAARVLWMVPFAVLTLVAAQFVFEFRLDAPRLGWGRTWGLSIAQAILGVVVVGAALRESIPGRTWSRIASVLWIAVPLAIIVAVTWISRIDPVRIRTTAGFYFIGGLCISGSLVSALPAVILANILAARAYPTRPAFAGALLGLGAGLTADAGWRLFCHYAEPAHVLSAHLGGVVVSMLIGSAIAWRFARTSEPLNL